MDIRKGPALAKWQNACLIITIVLSLTQLAVIVLKPVFLPLGMGLVSVTLIGLVELWSPLVFYWIGSLAISSLSASILGLMNLGAVVLIIQDPGSPKWLSPVFLSLSYFYMSYSIRTWRIYEIFWLERKRARPQ